MSSGTLRRALGAALLISASAAAAGPAETVRAYNEALAGRHTSGGAKTMAAGRSTLELLRARAQAYRELIRTNPAEALALALPRATRVSLASSAEAASYLESEGTWSGRSRALIEDDFATGHTNRVNLLDVGTESVEVSYAATPPEAGCSDTVAVEGVRLANAVAASAATVTASSVDPAAAACTAPIGERRALVILLSFPSTGLPANVTPAMAQNAFFGSGRSLDGFWREVSYGNTWATGTVIGPLVLASDYSCGDTSNIMKGAFAAAQGLVSFRDYTHIYFVFPKNGGCAAGTGSVSCWTQSSPQGSLTSGFVWIPVTSATTQDELTAIAVHEGGHNLGLEHSATLDFDSEPLGPPGSAGTFSEYGDRYSAMGVTWSINNNFGFGHYAAPQKKQLGWLQDNATVQTVQATGTYFVAPYETPSSGVQALRILRGTGGATWLWLEYRQPIGAYDPSLRYYSQTVFGGAVIHFEDPGDSARRRYSKLLSFNPVATPNNFAAAALPAGRTWSDAYSNVSIRVDSASAAGLSVSVTYGAASGPQLASSALSAADGSTAIAPGGIVSLYGTGLASEAQQASAYPLPLVLGGTAVEVVSGGAVSSAPLFFVSPGQINAQLPYGLALPAQVRVRTPSGDTIGLDLPVAAGAPRLFTSDMSGQGTAAALRWPDYAVISTATPARAGGVIMLYGTGLGAVNPPIEAGMPAGDGGAGGPLNNCDLPQVTIGGVNATVLWAGLAPGFSGLYQINVQTPASLSAGVKSVVVRAGGASSQSGVTLPVTR